MTTLLTLHGGLLPEDTGAEPFLLAHAGSRNRSEANWGSDVSEAARNSRRERRDSGGEKKASGGFGFAIGIDPMGNESGYGSEPGYRGDAEFGYGDEFDDEEEDVKPLFWEDLVTGSETALVQPKESIPHQKEQLHVSLYASQVLDRMLLNGHDIQRQRHQQKCFKSWKFKFQNKKWGRLSHDLQLHGDATVQRISVCAAALL